MSKGSKRRPGSGYAQGHDRIWGHQYQEDPVPPPTDLNYMQPIDRPEDITPDKLRFMRHALESTGYKKEAKILCWVADMLEDQARWIDRLTGGPQG